MPESISVTASSEANRRQAWRRHEDKQLLQRERELEAARRISDVLFQHISQAGRGGEKNRHRS